MELNWTQKFLAHYFLLLFRAQTFPGSFFATPIPQSISPISTITPLVPTPPSIQDFKIPSISAPSAIKRSTLLAKPITPMNPPSIEPRPDSRTETPIFNLSNTSPVFPGLPEVSSTVNYEKDNFPSRANTLSSFIVPSILRTLVGYWRLGSYATDVDSFWEVWSYLGIVIAAFIGYCE